MQDVLYDLITEQVAVGLSRAISLDTLLPTAHSGGLSGGGAGGGAGHEASTT